MLHRIHEILIVASPYDAFIIEEDGRLSEQILHEYLGINLRYAPRVWRASTAAEAMELLAKRKINLVVTMLRVPDMDPISFGRQVKEEYQDVPVVLMTYDTAQLKHLPDPLPRDAVDQAFIWTGNAKVLMAIIKYFEDKRNVDRDIRKADVRAMILVEDDPYYYSVILPLLYSEIYYHTRHLLDKSLNDAHRLLRMRGRPKILLANTYEEVEDYFDRYRENILGVISDTRFPKGGVFDDEAGLKLVRYLREQDPHMPIMLQSTSEKNAVKAKDVQAHFLYKKSQTLLWDLREFMVNNFGFGDFIFRDQDGEEIGRATDLLEFEEHLITLPKESLLYHAASNHFSNWLAVRGEFQLASLLRPVQVSDFDTLEEMRDYLIDAIDEARHVQQKGRIVEFSESSYDPSASITNIRSGSLGGKARGLAFATNMLHRSDIEEKFPDINIRIPKIAVIGTDAFDEFMRQNHLWDKGMNWESNEEIKREFYAGSLPEDLVESLRFYLERNRYPLSVRSSSLFEDSQYHSLAGMYSTYLLPNSHDDVERNLHQLSKAVKLVYASMFFQAPKAFLKSSIHRQEEEKMAVIIQELVGQNYGDDRYYPSFSGVAQSINYYPISYLEREDGIAYVALGLGKTVVEMEKSLRFCPKYPDILPQFYSSRAVLENSQRHFYALRLDGNNNLLERAEMANLGQYDLTVAEEDGSLRWVGSVMSAEDNILRDSLNYEGTRVVTFANILKWKAFPLADLLAEMLELSEQSLGCPAEIEFAVNMHEESDKPSEFYLLQIRPMSINKYSFSDDYSSTSRHKVFCKSDKTLGDGLIKEIRNILYVKPDTFDAARSKEIGQEVGEFNRKLGEENPYLLMGPGRWGSADPWLGIPVEWDGISHAKVIVEYNTEDFDIEPSFGGHFFQNIAGLRIGYLMVNQKSGDDFIEWDWLEDQEVQDETEYLKWVRLEHPVTVQIDSSSGEGVCLKPQPPEPEEMDEHEASGI
ncbi:MAG: hypothetical protein K9N46_01150 [Candidatus Marinimicrobia bacterium]|nr:hypothetical protein [Candidatus Neomarinimicrobiota bacterium]MCF7827917.1 hypothetical protein [Candidatus Neomarinimicrobiota bacterium]MCF7879328.1 hypothetical protein [Candidatus Neomarinimicrobiota bacterium]